LAEPCVKGTLFQNLADPLLELIESRKLRQSQVDSLLKPEEQDRLDRERSISAWYPVDLYCRMLALYALAAEGDPNEFLIESGRRSARQVVELGIYSQLDDRTRKSWESRVGQILVTLSRSFFNFGRWEWRGLERNGFSICVTGAAPLSDQLCLQTAGFVEYLTERAAGAPIALLRERSADGDQLVFRARRLG